MRIALTQPGVEYTGYGLLGLGIERGLKEIGHDIDDTAGVRLHIGVPWGFMGKHEGEELWLYSMFEGTRLPESYKEHLDNFDGVITPNDWNVEMFSKEHPNVHRARHGIDPFWAPIQRSVDNEIVVAYFGKGRRKGADLAPLIFSMAFPDADRLEPKPVFVHHRLGRAEPAEVVRQRFYDAHICLAPSRGEGWNFMPFQALATGCPTVLTHMPGHDQYDYVPGAYTFPASAAPCEIGSPGTWWAGEWWEPDIAEAAAQLRHVYENYHQTLSDARRGAQAIHRDFTWGRAASEIVEALGAAERPSRGTGYVPPRNRRFEFLLDRVPDCPPDIGGYRLELVVGPNLLRADHARVLQEAGYGKLSGNWMTGWGE